VYSLTDDQKKTAKWLVEQVRQKKLDEEFKIMWCTASKPSNSYLRFFDREGQEHSILIKVSEVPSTQESLEAFLKASSQNGLLSYQETVPSPYQTWDCTLTSSIYTAVDNDFKKNLGYI
jgi:hypothetical protein